MKYKDYYKTLGVARTANPDEIKQAYRKLARKYHPDVSKLADAEARFKEINEANEVLKDPEKRSAYDRMGADWKAGQDFQPPPNWDAGYEFRGRPQGGGGRSPFGPGGEFSSENIDMSDFFESLFARGGRAGAGAARGGSVRGEDHHAKVMIDLADAYRGAERSISLRMPVLGANGQVESSERTLDVHIPKGIRAGQSLRLAGQGGAGSGGAPAGDLFLEIEFNPDARFRIDGRDVYVDLPLAPWEAALGGVVNAPTPDGTVQLSVPANSVGGRKLRLKGRGLPGKTPGDLYAVLTIALPQTDNEAARAAYETMAKTFPSFDPRLHLRA